MERIVLTHIKGSFSYGISNGIDGPPGNLNFFCDFPSLRVLHLDRIKLAKSNDTVSGPDILCHPNLVSLTLKYIQYLPQKLGKGIWNLKTLALWNRDAALRSMPLLDTKSNLEIMDLRNFSDKEGSYIPASWEKHLQTNLVRLRLSQLNLKGLLPIWNMTKLEILFLSMNNFQDTLQANFFHSNKLSTIDLSYNKGINGTLPALNKKRIQSIKCLFLHGTNVNMIELPILYLQNMEGVLTLKKSLEYNLYDLNSIPNRKMTCIYARENYLHPVRRDSSWKAYLNPYVLCLGNRWADCLDRDIYRTWNKTYYRAWFEDL
jgi:hypothetical protein